MRLWSVHPRYLDPQGLVALWREGLLAQAVLFGETRGYRHHPQLARFLAHRDPQAAIGTYLSFVADEAQARGYTFTAEKIRRPGRRLRLTVTDGQLACEFAHLRDKLTARSPDWLHGLAAMDQPHPMFSLKPGPVAEWERAPSGR